jgi:formylglycine-generating enzyme required for sulfatase activity
MIGTNHGLEEGLLGRAGLGSFVLLVVAVLTGCGDDASAGGGSGGSEMLTGGTGGTSGAGGSGAGTAGTGGGVPISCPASPSGPELIAVPAGEFLMGCNTAADNQCKEDEKPGHLVTLSAYEIGKTEVTQEQYAGCVDAGACSLPFCEWDCATPGMPAGCVTRDQAIAYCAWAGGRLPTEAEWEKAARGTDGRKFPWGEQPPDCTLANLAGCSGERAPVDAHPAGASPYGALDMAGNMVEVVADFYDPAYYGSAPATDPKGPAAVPNNRYVGRGGGWRSDAEWHRTSVRDMYDTEDEGTSLGFRCAR